LVNADAFFDDNEMLASHCDGELSAWVPKAPYSRVLLESHVAAGGGRIGATYVE